MVIKIGAATSKRKKIAANSSDFGRNLPELTEFVCQADDLAAVSHSEMLMAWSYGTMTY